MSRAKMSRAHWSIIGYDEQGDQDGELCRCEIGESHAAGAKVTEAEATVRRVREFVDGFTERGGGRVNTTDQLWILALRKVLDGEQ